MADESKAYLTKFGGDGREYVVRFTPWFDRAEAQIEVRVKEPAPPQDDPVKQYRPLLHRLGEAAQLVAVSPQALAGWPPKLVTA